MTRAFAEFFAGIGLVRLALEPLGWRCAFANDIDPRKAAIYRQNFPAEDLVVGDIFELSLADVPAATDLWTASFPCTDLSLAGNRAGLAGAYSSAFWGFARLLAAAQRAARAPRFVLLENVIGFASASGGADLAAALRALSDAGYGYDLVMVDARRFTAQSRPRLFILAEQGATSQWRSTRVAPAQFAPASRPAIVQRFIAAHPELDWLDAGVPAPPDGAATLRDIVEHLPPEHPSWWSADAIARLLASMAPLHQRRLAAMGASTRVEFGTVFRRVRNGRTMAELRWDGLAGCLRTPGGGSSKQFLLQTDDGGPRVRNLSVREGARLQGVPDYFSFDVPTNQAWHGLGDAVCVPAVRWLAQWFDSGQPGGAAQPYARTA